MDEGRTYRRISNAFYNRGLEMAAERNLSGSSMCLKKALLFNRDNIDARNLLGLIYYETGEIADAVVQWLISLDLKPEKNAASQYMADVQKDQAYMELCRDNIRKYNQALSLAQSGSEDLAAIQLTQIVESQPGYIRPRLLLALIQVCTGEYRKAGRELTAILKLDTRNQTALSYLQAAREGLAAENESGKKGKAAQAKAKASDIIEMSHAKLIEDDVIMPSTYKESNWLQIAANIILGIVVGAFAVLFLYMPAQKEKMNEAHKQELMTMNENLSAANMKIDDQRREYDKLMSDLNLIKSDSDIIDDQYAEKLSGYQSLLAVLEELNHSNISVAAELYSGINPDMITDISDGKGISSVEIYNSVKTRMEEQIYMQLINMGDGCFDKGQYTDAIRYFNLSVCAKPENPVAIYKKGLTYDKMGENEEAAACFDEVVKNYPESSVAAMIKQDRGY